MRTRPNAFSRKGVVSSSSLQSSLAGAKVLENGGNVADAAIATSAVLCVTQNNLCGLGGDLFTIVRMDGKPIKDINGSGRASHNATIDYFKSKGLDTLPPRGENAALTVPGIVDAWRTVNSEYGTMEIGDLLAPAIKLAKEGFPVTHNYHHSIEASAKYLGQYGWGDLFTPGGNVPETGSLFKQKELGETLSLIASEGPESYYSGFLADRIVKGLEGTGCVLDSEDFRKHETTVRDPLKTQYHGYDLYETRPNSQAATATLWLNLYDIMTEEGTASDEDKFMKSIRSGLVAYGQRAKHITDPKYHDIPEGWGTRRFAEEILNEADLDVTYRGEVEDPGDTTYFNLADGDGNSLSVIQSNYAGFGTGITPKGTGFILQNRGSYFSLDPEHHNSLMPGKRTFHTLCAAMAEKDGDFQFSAGTMGGDIQPQVHFQLITALVDDGMDPQLALDKPRWAFPHTIYENPGDMIVESGLYETLSGYRNLPLRLKRIEDLSSQTGHAQLVQQNSFGVVVGGADPRGDGISIGVQ